MSTDKLAAAQPKTPEGYKLVMVPDEAAPDEPDWDECKRQAEVVTGLKVEQHTFSILKREVRRWLAHKKADERGSAEPVDWNQKRLTNQAVAAPFMAWLEEHRGCNGVGANEAWNAGVAWAKSTAPARDGSEPGLMEALARVLPIFDRVSRDLVFTRDKAGQFIADMQTLKGAATPEQRAEPQGLVTGPCGQCGSSAVPCYCAARASTGRANG